jgi:formylglycine-generating enzyme required for sulfatase activity
MGKYPVTQAQWKIVASLPQVNRELKPDPSYFKGDNRPVESVSWYDAVEFCQRLSQRTNRTYRLPSEAEWEYACRAGTTTPFHFEETITTDLANYCGTDDKDFGWSGSYGRGPKGEYRVETTAVDHFGIANAFGLCDMHGNVWEWCLDHWHGNYEDAPDDGRAWLRDDEDAPRVQRGGSWYYNPRNCRSASRDLKNPDHDNYNIGFRVVCEFPRILQ